MKARIVVSGLRKNFVHNIRLEGVRDLDNSYSLVHAAAYYTLNNIPEGTSLTPAEISTKRTPIPKPKVPAATKETAVADNAVSAAATATKKPGAAKPTFASVKPLLVKNTCIACHSETKRLVGPAYTEVAKRKYSVAQIVKLIYNPQKSNWPDYETEMHLCRRYQKRKRKKLPSG
jgi:cytochrome c551/c552